MSALTIHPSTSSARDVEGMGITLLKEPGLDMRLPTSKIILLLAGLAIVTCGQPVEEIPVIEEFKVYEELYAYLSDTLSHRPDVRDHIVLGDMHSDYGFHGAPIMWSSRTYLLPYIDKSKVFIPEFNEFIDSLPPIYEIGIDAVPSIPTISKADIVEFFDGQDSGCFLLFQRPLKFGIGYQLGFYAIDRNGYIGYFDLFYSNGQRKFTYASFSPVMRWDPYDSEHEALADVMPALSKRFKLWNWPIDSIPDPRLRAIY